MGIHLSQSPSFNEEFCDPVTSTTLLEAANMTTIRTIASPPPQSSQPPTSSSSSSSGDESNQPVPGSRKRKRYVTHHYLRKALENQFNLQAKGIQAEFKRQRETTDAQFDGVRAELKRQRETTDAQFKRQRDITDARFDGIRAEFKRQRETTDAQFERQREATDAQFQSQREATDALRAELKELKAEGSQFQARLDNRSAVRLWSPIKPVGRIDKSTGMLAMPPDMPATVGHLWRLKQPKGWPALKRLHEFYGTDTWPKWGSDFFDFDIYDAGPDEPLAPRHESLQEAISNAPEVALVTLCNTLGLDYDRISQSAEEAIEKQRSRQAVQTKRSTRAEHPEGQAASAKRAKPLISEVGERPSRYVMLSDSGSQVGPLSTPSAHTGIGWDVRTRQGPPTESPTSVATSLKDAKSL